MRSINSNSKSKHGREIITKKKGRYSYIPFSYPYTKCHAHNVSWDASIPEADHTYLIESRKCSYSAE
jgi:hypothetical protein